MSWFLLTLVHVEETAPDQMLNAFSLQNGKLFYHTPRSIDVK